VRQAEAAAGGNGRGCQALQREAQLACGGRGGQRVLVAGHDSADARDAQPGGGPACAADPAAHRPGRDIQVQGDTAVPGPAGGGEQGLPEYQLGELLAASVGKHTD
jgi:hypothetical protein